MTDFDTISGEMIIELIDELIKNRTFVKVDVPGTSYERLTMITRKTGKGAMRKFEIDPPEGMKALLPPDGIRTLHFEFSNENKLPHRFRASVASFGETIWLTYPDTIRRYQLRNNFRIMIPGDTHCATIIQGTNVHMGVENISLGGMFCYCPDTFRTLLKMGLSVKNLQLRIAIGGKEHMLSIDSALVRRIEGRVRPKHFGIAFDFIGLKPETMKGLTQVVYGLQRNYLQNRLKNP